MYSTYILVLIGIGIAMLASAKLRATYSKYSRVPSRAGDYVLIKFSPNSK